MRTTRILSLGLAAAAGLATVSLAVPAHADWQRHWHHGHWANVWVPPAVVVAPPPYAPPPVYYAPPPPPVVYAPPPPAYYPAPGISVGIRLP